MSDSPMLEYDKKIAVAKAILKSDGWPDDRSIITPVRVFAHFSIRSIDEFKKRVSHGEITELAMIRIPLVGKNGVDKLLTRYMGENHPKHISRLKYDRYLAKECDDDRLKQRIKIFLEEAVKRGIEYFEDVRT